MKKLLLLLIFLSQVCFAWGKLGHRVIGNIADNHLTPEASLYVKNILSGKNLAQISTWLDDIKSNNSSDYKKFRTWHYLDENKNNPKGDVFTGINYAMNILQNREKYSHDKQKQALAILVHIIGDLHQPLHIGNGLDWGANKCIVHWFSKRRKVSLHKVWDSYLPNSEGLSYSELAKFIDTDDINLEKKLQSTSVKDWVSESRSLHDKIYPDSKDNKWHSYCSPSKDQVLPILSYKYIYLNTPLMEQRMLYGGIRLAGIINKLANDEVVS